MREIKFRVWDKEEKYFNSDYSINGQFIYGYCEGRQIPKDEQYKLVFMQYTGLKDKNGIEIFEGDIIEYVNWDDEKQIQYTNILIEDIRKLPNIDFEYTRVIGNLYKNPELLSE